MKRYEKNNQDRWRIQQLFVVLLSGVGVYLDAQILYDSSGQRLISFHKMQAEAVDPVSCGSC